MPEIISGNFGYDEYEHDEYSHDDYGSGEYETRESGIDPVPHGAGLRLLDLHAAGLLSLEVAEQAAAGVGVCLRPLPFRVTDPATGVSRLVEVACGARQESRCAPCARTNRLLRLAQCREGWHLEADPEGTPGSGSGRAVPTPDETGPEVSGGLPEMSADGFVSHLDGLRAEWQTQLDAAVAAGVDQTPDGVSVADLRAVLADLDTEIGQARGAASVEREEAERARRVRSTRRRQDAPDLPARPMADTTLGPTFAGRDGKVHRPSMFVTLTLPSYGRVTSGEGGGVPVDADTYDYVRAARDALHFAKLVDRFVQNLRRVAGFKVQYFAAVESQKRLAPHVHMAIRGAIPRATIKEVAAATYHQVWWPSLDEVKYDGDHLPVWVADEPGGADAAAVGNWVDPDTGEILPTWEEALDALGLDQEASPAHVVRFGDQLDIQGLTGDSPDADARARYLAKYLTKSLSGAALEGRGKVRRARRAHLGRLMEVLRWEPCSERCANWLRYGIQPKGAHAHLVPGRCKGKAHRSENAGYGGRRVLVSRLWSGKALEAYRAERRAWVVAALGLPEVDADAGGLVWERVKSSDPHLPSPALRLLRLVAERVRGRQEIARQQAALENVSGDGPPEAIGDVLGGAGDGGR
ncbi:helitron helicase-like domain-containing protein [Herbidospora solisilvae]|uniref:helitron helicase-like domain-containing protein n=1 Tax=Herbidospora solisilvae TaxID=2696284 RepID=UPI001F3C7EED|nr:helitron helicase-like domain-containing protein [Herbidospora solisilvae]